jgi:PAS domain S-box-containing protein
LTTVAVDMNPGRPPWAGGEFAGTPIPMVVIDGEGTVRWMNPAAIELAGEDRAGKSYVQFLPPELREVALQRFARKLEQVDTHETFFYLANGNVVSGTTLSFPIHDHDGVVRSFALVLWNIRPLDGGLKQMRWPKLTPRQQQILELLVAGRRTDEIALELEVSPETVRNHVRAVLAELRARTRLEAVAKAMRLGIVR